RLIICAVRVVTVRTLHQSFRHAMMRRQRKLSLNRRMTGVAQLRLGQSKKTLRQPSILFTDSRRTEKLGLRERRFDLILDSGRVGQMRRVAGLASDAMKLVLRLIK